MKDVKCKKFNRFSKYYLDICQLIVMGLLFLFVLNNELVMFVKEFVGILPVGAGIVESVAVKGYFVFKILATSPSFFVFTYVFFQLMIFAYAFRVWIVKYGTPWKCGKEDIVSVDRDIIDISPIRFGFSSVDMRLLL